MAAGAATIYRNDLVPCGGDSGQTAERQLLRELSVEDGDALRSHLAVGLHHAVQITDLSAPDERFATGWARGGPGVLAGLQGGQRWVLHCRGGLGRAGSVAAYMLVQTGVAPGEAIRRVRAARPGAIETAAQVAWVMS